MYSRPQRDARIPSNYGGSMFGAVQTTPVEDLTRHRPTVPPPPVHDNPPECDFKEEIECEKCPQKSEKCDHGTSILSPLGALGTEELLLIALALIVFQGEKEPELALILLALLFIS